MLFKQIPNAITSTRRPEEPENGHRNVCITLLQPCLGSSVKGRLKTRPKTSQLYNINSGQSSQRTQEVGFFWVLGRQEEEGGESFGETQLQLHPAFISCQVVYIEVCLRMAASPAVFSTHLNKALNPKPNRYPCSLSQVPMQNPKPYRQPHSWSQVPTSVHQKWGDKHRLKNFLVANETRQQVPRQLINRSNNIQDTYTKLEQNEVSGGRQVGFTKLRVQDKSRGHGLYWNKGLTKCPYLLQFFFSFFMIPRGYMPGITGKNLLKKMGPFSKNWGELEQALCFFEASTKLQRGKCALQSHQNFQSRSL